MSAPSKIGTSIRASSSLPMVVFVRRSAPISGSFHQEQDGSTARIERDWHFALMASGITIAVTTTALPAVCRIREIACDRPHKWRRCNSPETLPSTYGPCLIAGPVVETTPSRHS